MCFDVKCDALSVIYSTEQSYPTLFAHANVRAGRGYRSSHMIDIGLEPSWR